MTDQCEGISLHSRNAIFLGLFVVWDERIRLDTGTMPLFTIVIKSSQDDSRGRNGSIDPAHCVTELVKEARPDMV